ncbi:7950_t:CDS:2 [Entrophospora sp. SA101]|nr:7950_t:CDS:2 [Entrophospora sp. SA101]
MTSAVKRSYPFGSRPTSLVEDSNQFQVAQIPSSHKKKPVTSPNINKSPLPSPPSAKGRKNMKNLQLVVPPVRSSISAPNSPQLPPNNSTYSAYSHNRRPSTPLCFYQNKDVANSNAADPMALMSKTENAIGEELPYKEEPIRILDNLYLGSELNAANRSMLNRLNIEFILNVGKEVENPYLDEIVNSNTSDTNTSDTTTSYFDYQHFSSSMLPNPSTPSDDSFKSDIQSPLPQFHEPASFVPSPIDLLRSNSLKKKSAISQRIPLTVPATSKHNKQIKYKKFFWTHNQENLISDFDSAFAFINEARSAGYVMEANSMNLNQAYEFVKNRSPYISPNMSLVYQLVDFEKTLKLNNNNESHNNSNRNSINSSLPSTPTKSQAESIKSHSRQSSIESDLLLKSHRRSSSIPRTQINNNSNHTTNNGLLSIQPHQATVKGNGSGRFHVITASMTPTTPTALSPASSLSPTSSTSPTTPSNELSSPTTNNSKSNSKPILDGIFSPTRTSPPITPVTITNFHDLLGDDVNKDIYTIQ